MLVTEALLERGTAAVVYETLEDDAGWLPLLAPMSAVAGNDGLRAKPGLAKAVNVHDGHLTCKPVADLFGLESRYRPFT